MKYYLSISIILPVIGSCAWADQVVMVDGHVLEGKIVRGSDPLQLQMIDDIIVSIPASRIKKTIDKQCVLDQYKLRRENVSDNDVDGLVALADWCDEKGLVGQRIRLLESVLEQNPDSQAARAGLGYTRFDDQWYQSDALEKVSRKPITSEIKANGERMLPAWIEQADSENGLHVASVPLGLSVHVASKEEVGSNRFDIGQIKYLKGRTPLSLVLPPGSYYVAVERVTQEKQEYHPESEASYSGKTEAGYLHANLFQVNMDRNKTAYIVSLFYPKNPDHLADFKNCLPPEAAFQVPQDEFNKWVKNLDLSSDQRREYFHIICRAGKVLHAADQRYAIACYAGKGNIQYSMLGRVPSRSH